MKPAKPKYTFRLNVREFFIVVHRSGLTAKKLSKCIEKLNDGIITPEFAAAFDQRRMIPDGARPHIQRTHIFERDKYTCTYCGETGSQLEVDHIHPFSKGGGSHDDNLTTACKPCNRDKGAKTLDQWRGVHV